VRIRRVIATETREYVSTLPALTFGEGANEPHRGLVARELGL
jgi:hypothetical protein